MRRLAPGHSHGPNARPAQDAGFRKRAVLGRLRGRERERVRERGRERGGGLGQTGGGGGQARDGRGRR